MSDARKTNMSYLEKPTLREKAAALAVMASEVLLMVLEESVEAATPAVPKPKAASAPKPTAKRKGRPPMTEEQRAAAKAVREGVVARAGQKAVSEAIADLSRPKPQPVTRASLAAQNAAPAGTSYFTKAG